VVMAVQHDVGKPHHATSLRLGIAAKSASISPGFLRRLYERSGRNNDPMPISFNDHVDSNSKPKSGRKDYHFILAILK
jgi:hypothetical protein